MINPSAREYNATASNPRPCYSDQVGYGCNGAVFNIIPPSPAYSVPAMFNAVKPHNIETMTHRPCHSGRPIPHSMSHMPTGPKCTGYKTLSGVYRR